MLEPPRAMGRVLLPRKRTLPRQVRTLSRGREGLRWRGLGGAKEGLGGLGRARRGVGEGAVRGVGGGEVYPSFITHILVPGPSWD